MLSATILADPEGGTTCTAAAGSARRPRFAVLPAPSLCKRQAGAQRARLGNRRCRSSQAKKSFASFTLLRMN
jgi:hypothetical protein